ncbi:hypothetical protein OIV83_003684 [Microbotryomycetes sp. JL201]|nr:hypothetical protein OIV83_003684 [Microbotryomycetes sp. JL201]
MNAPSDEAARDLAAQLEDVSLDMRPARALTPSPPTSPPLQPPNARAEPAGHDDADGGDLGRVSADLDRVQEAVAPRDLPGGDTAFGSDPSASAHVDSDTDTGPPTAHNGQSDDLDDAPFEPVSLEDDDAVQNGSNDVPTTTTATSSPVHSPPTCRSASSTPPTTASASFAASPTSTRQQEQLSPQDTSQRTAVDASAATSAVAAKEASTSSETPANESAPKSPEIPTKRRMSTKAPTVMQKVVSMTRQRDLPPKTKEEEKKHLRQLEEMRTASKEAGTSLFAFTGASREREEGSIRFLSAEKRRKAQLQQRAAARQHKIDLAYPAWDQAILPNWKSVLHDTPEGKHLRTLWWQGTMPTRYRGRLWGLCIGNGLAISKATLAGHVERARKAIAAGKYPQNELDKLLDDVQSTLPTLKLFQKDGVMHDDLVDVLLAFTVFEAGATGEVRYPAGLACPGAMLLVNMAPTDAWVSLVNLVDKSCLKSFYRRRQDEMEAYYRIFDTLIADSMPKVYENFLKQAITPRLYLTPWLVTIYVRFLPLDLVIRIFDVFVLEGDSFLFRVALSILRILEPRLFNPDQTDIQAVFDGTDRGAVGIVRRSKQVNDEHVEVHVEEVYEEMGCDEDSVFEGIRAMDWKEEHFQRLVGRELPDD